VTILVKEKREKSAEVELEETELPTPQTLLKLTIVIFCLGKKITEARGEKQRRENMY